MPLPPEFWGTIDTVVKVGLGVAVTGLFTITHSIVSNKHEREKELRRRRRDALEQIVHEFEATYAKFMYNLTNLYERIKPGTAQPFEPKELEAYMRLAKGLGDEVLALNANRGKLLLLGLKEAENCLELLTKAVVAHSVETGKSFNAQKESEAVEKYWDAIKVARAKLYEILSAAYCD